jgi:hypothetical protein
MVRLFNRRKFAYRLRHFSILASLDGISWTVLHRKSDDADFGADTLLPYTAALPPGSVGRYLRVQLDGTECLHFSECEVFGTKTEAVTLAAIERKEQERQSALRNGRQGRVAMIGNFGVFADTDKYSASVIKTLTEGWYEAREREPVGKLLQTQDRVLEVGTALGSVTMAAATVVGAPHVLTYEANPQIAADARRTLPSMAWPRFRRVSAYFATACALAARPARWNSRSHGISGHQGFTSAPSPRTSSKLSGCRLPAWRIRSKPTGLRF